MAKRGRKTLPMSEKKQYEPGRHGDRHERPVGSPVRPTTMSKVAMELWDAIMPELDRLNFVTALDQTQLEAMCEWFAEYKAWCEQPMCKETLSGKQKSYVLFMEIAAKFGLTPLDRRKLRPREPKEQVSEFTQFLRSKGVVAS